VITKLCASGILKLFNDALGFANPLLLNLLVLYVSDEDSTSASSSGWVFSAGYNGFLYAGGLLLIALLQVMI